MTTSGQWQRSLDAIVTLTEEIARISPDCADRAMQIAQLVRGLDPPRWMPQDHEAADIRGLDHEHDLL
ncbi:MAG: hypothetical protein PGN34_16830 [Methylobacterium frigidaeris]